MTLLLSGTDGLSDVDGSAATPAIRGTDANTGIFFPAADTIAFSEGGAESARFDSSGRLLIGGTASPVSSNIRAVLQSPVADGSGGIQLAYNNAGGGGGAIFSNAGSGLTFFGYTGVVGSESYTERMRITSAGDVNIGTTAGNGRFTIDYTAPATFTNTGSDFVSMWRSSGTNALGIASNTTGSTVRLVTNNGYVLAFNNGVTEAMRIDSSGNVGIGTSSPAFPLDVAGAMRGNAWIGRTNVSVPTGDAAIYRAADNTLAFSTASTERMRIDSIGRLLFGTTSISDAANGLRYFPGTGSNTETFLAVTNERTDGGGETFIINRQTSDGQLTQFRQANTPEGGISVSGTTVSYNGGHLSRFAQTLAPKDDSLLKGTVLSNLDEMNEYVNDEGNPVDNEQLNKVKVSDVEGDINVAGVFVNWSHDTAHDVDEINMAMTGDMIIRIAEGVTVQRGDLLMSAGDGTAKPQGDDIVRGKTVAKVTSTHITCTYADGSYCVPCVLMAC